MANKSIKISIATALNAVGITAAKRALSSLASHTKSFANGVASNLMNIKAGFDLVAAGASKFLAAMSKGMEFERMTTTFKSLTGSMELAKAHMKDLQDLGRTPPFSLEAFASASQMIMKMTDGMLGYKSSLEMVGDIAAATGNDISQVGRSVGLAYQMIRDGQPFGRAGSQMVQLGILTKAQVEHFDELSKAGGDNMAIWEELTKVLSKYKGAMAETEKTAKGMVEAIQGEATVAMTELSSAITETAKPALSMLLDYLRRINEDGTIEVWASEVVIAMNKVANAAKMIVGWFGKIRDGYNWVQNGLEKVGSSVGAFAGTIYGGGSIGDATNAAKTSWSDMRKEQADRAKEAAEAELKIREDAEKRLAERKKKRAEEAAKQSAEAEKRIREDLARAQAENDKKRAEEAAKKKEIEDLKAQKSNIEKIKILDNERIKEQEKKTKEMIDRLLAIGADKPMQRAGGGVWGNGTMDQAGDLANERQKKIDEARTKKAEDALKDKMSRLGATLDDPSKLGRMSNLEKAAFDKMLLDRENTRAQQLQKDRDELQKRMANYLDDINDRLKKLGL